METQVLEKRNLPRQAVNAAAVYFPYTSSVSPAIEVTVLNSSMEGLSFESRHPLKPGQSICIRTAQIDDTPVVATDAGLRVMALAQVRWCRERAELFGSEYRIGAKYVFAR